MIWITNLQFRERAKQSAYILMDAVVWPLF